ncbi:MAG: hypothetical protein ACREEP_04075, partial [Dongiaceae bacterium]
MLEFYVNYMTGSHTMPKRVQAGPYQTVAMAIRHRRGIENEPGISHCWVGVSRDETRLLIEVEASKVMP